MAPYFVIIPYLILAGKPQNVHLVSSEPDLNGETRVFQTTERTSFAARISGEPQ
jgi:hypothetical protein